MRKIILSFITFIGLFSLSLGFEGNIKVGYDFFRYSTYKINENTYSGQDLKKWIGSLDNNHDRGFIVGFEILPFTFKDERIKLGVGLEYNFGEKTVKYRRKTYRRQYFYHHGATMIPIYATAKFTYYRPKNIDLNLYTFGRLGYAVGNEIDEFDLNVSGIYYGLGLGIDYKYFLAEILYDGKYLWGDIDRKYEYSYNYHHKLGIRLGVQLGTQHFKKQQIKN